MTHPTLILGGGIIGLTTAYNLQQRGVATTLIDADTILGGASSGNAGHLAAEYNYPVANLATLARLPAILLNPLGPLRIDWCYLPRLIPFGCRMIANMTPARYQHIHRALYNLNRDSVAAWERLATRVPLRQYIHRDGILHIASRTKTAAGLADQAAKNRALGLACEHIPRAALSDYEPALAEDQQGGPTTPNPPTSATSPPSAGHWLTPCAPPGATSANTAASATSSAQKTATPCTTTTATPTTAPPSSSAPAPTANPLSSNSARAKSPSTPNAATISCCRTNTPACAAPYQASTTASS